MATRARGRATYDDLLGLPDHAEPFDAVELELGALWGDDDPR